MATGSCEPPSWQSDSSSPGFLRSLFSSISIFSIGPIFSPSLPTSVFQRRFSTSASAGLALTQGNSDTSTVNAAYELKHDSGSPIVFKSAGLLVWGKAEGELTSDRLALSARLERKTRETQIALALERIGE